jgi:glycosyltransferase involved in cell wall biosynthesis
MRLGEWFAYKFSDKIISILPNTYDHVRLDGVKRKNFAHVPNGINLEDYKNLVPVPQKLQNLIDKEKKKKHVLIGYAGAISVANAIDILVEAAFILQKEALSFIVIGDGQELENIKAMTRNLKLSNVYFYERIDKLQVHSFLKQMDFLYIGAQHQAMYKYGVGHNKAFDYMMAGRPVLQSLNVGGDVIKKAKAGINAHPGSAIDLAKVIKKAIKLPKTKIVLMAKNGKDYVLKHHVYEIIAEKFLDSVK